MAAQRQNRPARVQDYRAYQQAYSKKVWENMKFDNGFKIIYDPSGIYSTNALFGRRDFKQTLAAGIWPEHLIVRDLKTNECFQVNSMDLVEIVDRDWFAYRKEQLNA